MSYTFLVQPIIPDAPSGTWRFYIFEDYVEGAELNIFATSEVFESRSEALEAAGRIGNDARDLHLDYELNFGLHSDSYIARIIRHDTQAVTATTRGYDQPEQLRAALQELVNQFHLKGAAAPGIMIVDDEGTT